MSAGQACGKGVRLGDTRSDLPPTWTRCNGYAWRLGSEAGSRTADIEEIGALGLGCNRIRLRNKHTVRHSDHEIECLGDLIIHYFYCSSFVSILTGTVVV